MTVSKQFNTHLIKFFISFILVNYFSCIAFAQDKALLIPENAHGKSYGRGWECDLGYREVGASCEAIKIPENAFLSSSSFGNGWLCAWGFTNIDDKCVEIKIPAHAYLNSYGNNWECKRLYQKVKKQCVAVKVPEHAYYVDSGYGKSWKCERGYYEEKEACLVLVLPDNAHLDYSGHDWECNPPFIKQKGMCKLKSIRQ